MTTTSDRSFTISEQSSTQSRETATLTWEQYQQFQEFMRMQQAGLAQSQNNTEAAAALAQQSQVIAQQNQLIEQLKAQNVAHQDRHYDTVHEREALIASISDAEIAIGSLSGSAAVKVTRSSNSAPVSGLKINFYTSLLGTKNLVGYAFTNQDGIAQFETAQHSVSSVAGGLSGGHTAVFEGNQDYQSFEAQKGTNLPGMFRF
jgi:hypothetical protein